MSYASVMVFIEADTMPEQRICLGAGLADKFGAMLIGLFRRTADGDHRKVEWRAMLEFPAEALAREARRAVRDALPFLRQAERVTIVEACQPGKEKASLGRLDDVTRYLARHRIKSGPKVMLEQKGSGAQRLIRIAQEEQADLLVTGAYGHSRLGEWLFGGMTRELLASSPICCLMSH